MSVTIYTGRNTKGSGSQTKPMVCVPYIDEETGTWWVYDTAIKAYVDTERQAQGPAGMNGADGAQGVPGMKGDPGTSVYVTDVSESDVDGGTNFIFFSDGTVLEVKNGNRGNTGAAGTPGDSYIITSADYTEIANIAKADLIVATVAETKEYLGIS